MSAEEITRSDVIKENEEALEDAIQKREYLMAYICCYALLHRFLQLTLDVDYSIQDSLDLLRKRCRDCVSAEHRIADQLIHELKDLSSRRDRILEEVSYYGVRGANRAAYERVSAFYEKYHEMREWIDLYGPEISYREGIIISKKIDTRIDTGRLVDYLENIHSHSINTPESVRDSLTTCGFDVDILVCGKSNADKGIAVFEVRGDWGEPGISALYLVCSIFELLTGQKASSRYIGRGFQFNDILGRLKEFCQQVK